jgi:hypothetical protein
MLLYRLIYREAWGIGRDLKKDASGFSKVIGYGVVKVHSQFHQPKTEHTCIEIDIALRVAGNRRHMMNAENISTHSGQLAQPSPIYLTVASPVSTSTPS